MTPTDFLASLESILQSRRVRFERAASIAKLSAGYDVPGYRISVTAWDNASCLDIDVLETRSGGVRMLCAGATSGEADILARLDALESWARGHSGI